MTDTTAIEAEATFEAHAPRAVLESGSVAEIHIWVRPDDTRLPSAQEAIQYHDYQGAIEALWHQQFVRIRVVFVTNPSTHNVNWRALNDLCPGDLASRLYALPKHPNHAIELSDAEAQYIIDQLAGDVCTDVIEMSASYDSARALVTLHDFVLPGTELKATEPQHYLGIIEVWCDGDNTYISLPTTDAGPFMWNVAATFIGAGLAARVRTNLKEGHIYGISLTPGERRYIIQQLVNSFGEQNQ